MPLNGTIYSASLPDVAYFDKDSSDLAAKCATPPGDQVLTLTTNDVRGVLHTECRRYGQPTEGSKYGLHSGTGLRECFDQLSEVLTPVSVSQWFSLYSLQVLSVLPLSLLLRSHPPHVQMTIDL